MLPYQNELYYIKKQQKKKHNITYRLHKASEFTYFFSPVSETQFISFAVLSKRKRKQIHFPSHENTKIIQFKLKIEKKKIIRRK